MVRLGDICKFQSGGTPSKSTPDYFGGTIPWITTIALNGNVINETNAVQWITPKAIQETAAKIVPEYSILVGTRVGVGKVAINSVPMSTSQDIISLINIDSGHWDKKYLCKLILSKNDYLLSQARGATIKGIKIDTLANLIIPDVSLDEQRRIAVTLDKVTDLISKRRQQLDKLDELVKARFVEMFGTLQASKFGFPIVTIQDVCLLIKDGTHQTPEYTSDAKQGFKFLSSKDVMSEKISWLNIKYIPPELHNKLYAAVKPQRNDILMSKNGVNYGVAAVNDTDEIFDIYVSLALLRPKNCINSIYFRCAINNPDTKRQFDRSIKGIGVPNLHLSEIKKTKILLPPLELQNKFACFVAQIESTKATISHSLEMLETLKKALMQEYFG